MSDNIKITKEEFKQLRELADFDLTMVLSDIHHNGWPIARKTLECAYEATCGALHNGGKQ